MNNKTKIIALGGMLIALSVILILLAGIVPSGKISLYVLASFLTAIIIINGDIRFGIIFFISASILSWIVLPEKIAVIPYIVFFGWYGVAKYLIEKINNLAIELIIKVLIMDAVLFIVYFLFNSLIPDNIISKIDIAKLYMWGILIVLQVVFVVYDYVFTLVIDYYYKRFG